MNPGVPLVLPVGRYPEYIEGIGPSQPGKVVILSPGTAASTPVVANRAQQQIASIVFVLFILLQSWCVVVLS